ncbi:hypothetical protein AMS68_000918 [Peltaster fructicola]|uniref:WSC domain-containing protein n=1 Tax=Peltaster fructicola TaxID=286661 RepID=A0A6H0XL90_9PEZI|nr:hypothetical protein AMS68_000918 [Peltaster fructicola]
MARASAVPVLLSLLLSSVQATYSPGHHAYLDSLIGRATTQLTPASNSLPTNWTYTGCYNDNQGSRTLNGPYYGDGSGMNASTCVSFCASQNYVYAGTEYSSQCYCGNSIASGLNQTDATCNMACSGNSAEVCGGPNLLTIYYANTAAPIPPSVNPGPPGWTSYGCYAEGSTRTLANLYDVPGGSAKNMSVAACTSVCGANGYSLAGVEYASQCFCDNYISSAATNASASDCNMVCSGNSTEFCGAGNRLNLYAAGKVVPGLKPASKVVAPPPGWFSTGCYNDTVGTRTLNTAQYGLGDLNVENCTAACFKNGFSLAGMEYGNECYCDNSYQNYGAPATDGRCNMPCKGNANETCGGPNGLSVFKYTGWFSKGCYNDTVGTRSLNYAQYGLGDMTIEKCTAACQSAGYNLAGMEYANECFCDTAIQNNGIVVTDGRCNMACKGNANEVCGGPNGLSIYFFNSTGVVSSTTTTAAAAVAAGTSPAASPVSAAAVNTTAIAPFTYQGCFTDNSQQGRTLANQQPDNKAMTVESCVSTCNSLGYSIAGMEYGVQCFCDNFIRYSPSNVTASGDCSVKCGGNSGEYCGAGSRLSIYSNGTMVNYTPPTILQNVTQWQYKGCYSDIDGARTLAYKIPWPTNNTNEACVAQCQRFGYGIAGTEYGQECWCGDWQNVLDAQATLRPDSECNMLCSADQGKNGGHYCGGGSRLALYNWTGPLLTNWNYASGLDAGAYQFLIGGVNIPLVTAPARNGKVTYMSKFGTEPANNSTGAYELDLSLLNNFTAAWRPMHVKSDVFCSASLTLPDRAGRQINVGGWANDATYGVRLYWPDGVPGVWGQNDWQENVKEVSLLTGRWYPSAMIMANGSILVVGGEVGSNGAPVGDLEVLPSPAKQKVPAEYLTRTDPYSTYPFLAVLPSGGILVTYYNEARILDPVTLTTNRSLPNIPGAVNDFDGGRTYPFEGSSMLLPQHAPYTDPLGVLICGGSVPGPEFGLDNCVTIQPDQPQANWTIERMPSRRVMTYMCALPDGTYLITGGARQGRAGFGLATDPNYSAVLYDPSKPVNNRMTLMANTTVARLYHSEAVLLDDGRILISGSDPEDQRSFAPQEYRNEVFMPPYLLKGAPRPSFNVSSIDWDYSQSVQLTVQPSSGNSAAGYRVSLIGAVASTHGNSMGQRTFFPSFSCTGLTCTVTAPPNANICPPAWFQMFVLDNNNIPSNATWIRIGGDPGDLGSWPAFPDFNVPGQGPVIPLH